MTRKNRDPKEYLLSILKEHVKFLSRMMKKEIPDKMLTLIIERIKKNKIKKLEKTIKKKDVEIGKKDEEIENLHIMINTQSEVIDKKENEIMILEGKMSRLQVRYDECVDSNISLSYKLEIEHTEVDNLRTEVNNLQNANNEQTNYIQTKDRNLRKLVDKNLKLESDN
ncbi:941_t:CDS:2, partial [Dentiscutata heterogama]